MEEKQGKNKAWRLAADATGSRLGTRMVDKNPFVLDEDASPQVARDDIVKEMMRIFDGLLGCSAKRTGVSLDFLHAHKSKPASGTQKKLEQEIYRLIKGLVERKSPNIGFAVEVLFNNGTYYFNKAAVPLSFGVFLTSLVEFLEGHGGLRICPDEIAKLRSLLSRG